MSKIKLGVSLTVYSNGVVSTIMSRPDFLKMETERKATGLKIASSIWYPIIRGDEHITPVAHSLN